MTTTPVIFLSVHVFLLTCLLRGMTLYYSTGKKKWGFYSHASCEAWHLLWTIYHLQHKFLLTCLLRGMTRYTLNSSASLLFLLTCLLRGMTSSESESSIAFVVSTHMPLARHDSDTLAQSANITSFYSHASCEAWRKKVRSSNMFCAFLLTCLLRGMTAIFCIFFAIMPPYTRDRLFNKYIFLFFSDKVSLPRGEPGIVF